MKRRIRNDVDLSNVAEYLGEDTLFAANADLDEADLRDIDQTAVVACSKLVGELGVSLEEAAQYTGMSLYLDTEAGKVGARGVIASSAEIGLDTSCTEYVGLDSLATGKGDGHLPELDTVALAQAVLEARPSWSNAYVQVVVVDATGQIFTREGWANR